MLVVEDDPDVRRYVVTLLTGEGCDAVAVSDGVAALAAIEAVRPTGGFAVILLERCLPDRDGVQILRDIRCAGVQTPVIISTRFPDLDHAREAGALGAAAYYAKPLAGSALITALHRALWGRAEVAEPVPERGGLLAAALAAVAERVPSEAASPYLLHALASAAATPGLCTADFVGVSSGLALLADPAPSVRATRDGIERLTRIMNRSQLVDAYLDATGAHIDRAGRAWARVSVEDTAQSAGISASAFGRKLSRDLMVSFFHFRRAVVVRRGLVALACERDHIRQVGFALGYQTAGQFVVAVRHVTGMPPKEFRRLLSDGPSMRGV